jgi:hypothetical protein
MSREPVTPDTMEALATRLADVPVSPDKAQSHATVFESLMAVIAELRSLPLKEVEPAVIFAPEEEGR